MEAMGTAFTTIAQSSATGGQGGLSNLQRFMAHYPPAFKGGGDSMGAGRKDFGGHGDYLRCHEDQTSYV